MSSQYTTDDYYKHSDSCDYWTKKVCTCSPAPQKQKVGSAIERALDKHEQTHQCQLTCGLDCPIHDGIAKARAELAELQLCAAALEELWPRYGEMFVQLGVGKTVRESVLFPQVEAALAELRKR